MVANEEIRRTHPDVVLPSNDRLSSSRTRLARAKAFIGLASVGAGRSCDRPLRAAPALANEVGWGSPGLRRAAESILPARRSQAEVPRNLGKTPSSAKSADTHKTRLGGFPAFGYVSRVKSNLRDRRRLIAVIPVAVQKGLCIMRRRVSSIARQGANPLVRACVQATVVCSMVVSASAVAKAQGNLVPPTRRISYDRDEFQRLNDDLSNSYNDDPRRFSPDRRPMMPPNPANPTPEMRRVRPLVRQFADDISQLVFALNDQTRRVPSMRSMLREAMSVSAMAQTLNKDADRYNDHRFLLEEFQQVDAQWRALAFRLSNMQGLTTAIRQQVDSLSELDAEIRDSIGMQPQMNRRELALKANDLATDLRNLIEDVRAELGRSTESQQFQTRLQQARQQILSLASLAEDTTADQELIINEYQRFQQQWYPQRASLQSHENSYFERSLRRITQTDGEIHRLLLLPQKVDSQQLLYLASALERDIDEYFDRMSLRLLMHLPKADRVAGVASQFYGVCEHFVDEVNRNESPEHLAESFTYIEDAQRDFLNVFSDIDSDEALAALDKIEQTITALRSSLQLEQNSFNRQETADLAAGVIASTQQLSWAVDRWLSSERPAFANACRQSVKLMQDQTVQLQADIVRGASLSQLGPQIEQLYDSWRTVYNYLVKCQTADRSNLGRLSNRITPALVDLRTMLTQ
jgi:hypothetical protein